MNNPNKNFEDLKFNYQALKKLYLTDQMEVESFLEQFLVATVGNENLHDLREQAKKILKKNLIFHAVKNKNKL